MTTFEEVKAIIRGLLVSSPVKVTIRSIQRDYYELEGRNIPFRELGFNNVPSLLYAMPDVLRISGTAEYSEISLVVNEKTAHVANLVMKQRLPSKGKQRFQGRKSIVTDTTSPSYNQQPTVFLSPFPKPYLSPQASNLTNYSLKRQSLNYTNQKSCELNTNSRRSLQSTSSVSTPQPKNITNRNQEVTTPHITRQKFVEKVKALRKSEGHPTSIDLSDDLKTLISKFPNGLPRSNLSEEYKKLYGRDLDYNQYGFPTLEDIFICVNNILYDKSKSGQIPKPFKREDIFNPYTIKPSKSEDWITFADLIPEDAFPLGETIPHNHHKTLEIDKTYPVLFGDICDPDMFWFRITDRKFDQMMTDLQEFYSENKQKYLILEFLVDVGLYCVVKKSLKFQRGFVIDMLSNGYVKIYLIDVGTSVELQKIQIYFASRRFCSTPHQALLSYLADITNGGDSWSVSCCSRFRELLHSQNMSVKICQVDHEKVGVVVNKSIARSVTDYLVEEGFGKYKNVMRNGEGSLSVTKSITVRQKLLELGKRRSNVSSEM